MKSRSLRCSLLKLMILIPLTLDNMVQSAVITSGNRNWITRKINLRDAVKATKTLVCKEPQYRAYNLRDLMQNVHQNPTECTSQPAYIVLKRCDGHSGCCKSPDMSCLPTESAIYYEEIEIEIWNLETQGRKQWIRVEQHGECTCNVTTTNDRYRSEHQQPFVTLV